MLATLQHHVGSDETLRWHSRPDPRRVESETRAMLGVFWIAALGLLAFMESMSSGAPYVWRRLLELGVICVVTWFSIRRILAVHGLHRTIHGITDERLLIVRAGHNPRFTGAEMPERQLVHLHPGWNGQSRIRFAIDATKRGAAKDRITTDHIDLFEISDGDRAFALLTR